MNLLSHTNEYQITVADRDKERLDYVLKTKFPNTACVEIDLADAKAVTEIIRGHDITMSACPYFLNQAIVIAAKKVKKNWNFLFRVP